MSCGLYQPQTPTEEAKAILKRASTHPAAALFADSKPGPFLGFHTNEQYTSLDLTDSLTRHSDRIWAVYGDEDRIISEDDRVLLREALGPRFFAISGAAHNVFIDAQPAFLESIAAVIAKTHPGASE
jgi:pimeloyl-ACP methyl ester carboxylesterase